jgi:hypothetical protein
MKEAILDDLTAYVLQAVGPLFGSRSRKQQMQEELLAHLLSLYDEELASLQDEQKAAVRAKQRFGRVDDLCNALQAAVPLPERLGFLISRKGILMKRWLWIIGCVAVYVGMGLILPAIQLWRSGGPNGHLSVTEAFWMYPSLPLLGLVLTLGGLGAIAYGVVRAFRARRC